MSMLFAAAGGEAIGQKAYGPGVSDTEIVIGQTAPYSGPASALSRIHKSEVSYFEYLNAKGGISGRKVRLLSYDDGFSPPKAFEQVRRLVEQDEVAAVFSLLGTAINISVRQYLNGKKVPQLFTAAQSSSLADPQRYPYTMGLLPTLRSEGVFYGKHIVATKPRGKIAVIYQNDDFGKDLVGGLKEGLGSQREGQVDSQPFEVTVPTVENQVAALAASRPEVLLIFAYPKHTAQAIRKVHEMGWKPTIYMFSGSGSISSTIKPAGVEASTGVLRAAFFKDPTDPRWKDDPEMKEWLEYSKQYTPDADVSDYLNSSAIAFAKVLEQVLRQCGDNLTRENILKQAQSLHDFPLPLGLPGAVVNTSETNYEPVKFMELQRFDGSTWVPVEQ
ncbi:ABC transporter substrate-binding protein [Bradyrhizobium sp. AUGA SZCCT0240]|uniref:ABC transporter substrate-binding protein n=1 Tax=Bradyrhizobium sp. AUGA SZCCT0240 TaxID=2807669 RepID=UPI001BAD2CBA|nr:ABC transporter substrate-binding protein [Bradyrhizobium sp. AUGA SZCCT0240]MBR1256365.1 ABC transporter substrate-binding protein [Bradyrhizobium sp. AUGA SZCCT0240]